MATVGVLLCLCMCAYVVVTQLRSLKASAEPGLSLSQYVESSDCLSGQQAFPVVMVIEWLAANIEAKLIELLAILMNQQKLFALNRKTQNSSTQLNTATYKCCKISELTVGTKLQSKSKKFIQCVAHTHERIRFAQNAP